MNKAWTRLAGILLLLVCIPFSQIAHAKSFDFTPDFNEDCELNAFDFLAYHNAYLDGEPRADTNGDGTLGLPDFLSFQNAFQHHLDTSDALPNCGSLALLPGSGFTGVPEAEYIGTPGAQGYDAKAVARWNVVPYQTFDRKFAIGVVAFHMNGIDRVEFSLNGGPWTAVSEPTLNPRTGVIEYTALLDASKMPSDAMVEIQAVVYPHSAGKTRVLAGPFEYEPGVYDGTVDIDDSKISQGDFSLFLYANGGGKYDPVRFYVDPRITDGGGAGTTGDPFATIRQAWEKIVADQITDRPVEIILTQPGAYAVAETRNGKPQEDLYHWVTIKSAPGLDRTEVTLQAAADTGKVFPLDKNEVLDTLTPSARVNSNMLMNKLQGVGVDVSKFELPGSSKHASYLLNVIEKKLWLDDFYFTNSETWADPNPGKLSKKSRSFYFVTNSLTEDGEICFTQSFIVRNSTCKQISGDVFQSSRLILNNFVDHVDGGVVTRHTDLFQNFAGGWTGAVKNRIAFNNIFENVISSQNVLYNAADGGFHELAFVNNFVENINSSAKQNQPDPTDHLILLNFGNPGVNWTFRKTDHRSKYYDASDGLLQKNFLMKGNVFSRVGFPQDQLYVPGKMDVSHNHINQGSDKFTRDLTEGEVYPAKNVERGAYAFGGPGKSQLNIPGSAVHNLRLPNGGENLRGPDTYLRACNQNDHPVSMIAADPLKVGLGKFIKSDHNVDFYANASFGCTGEITQTKWFKDGEALSTEDKKTMTFSVPSSNVKTLPFRFQLPELYQRDADDRCVEVPEADRTKLAKLFPDDLSQLEIGQLLVISGTPDMPTPDPLADDRLYEIAHINPSEGYIQVRLFGYNNVMSLNYERYMCKEGGDVQTVNERTYYLQTVELHESIVELEVVDDNARKNRSARSLKILSNSEPHILTHLDFEFPLNPDLPAPSGDTGVVDVSGNAIHGNWRTDTDEPRQIAQYGSGISGRSAVFSTSQNAGIFLPTDLITGKEAFSISVWVKKDRVDEQDKLIDRHTVFDFKVLEDEVLVNLRIQEESGGNEEHSISVNANINDQNWHHYAVTFDGTRGILSIYVNGEEVHTENVTTGRVFDNGTWPTRVGKSGGQQFDGAIDELKFYSKALDASKVRQLYNELRP